MTRHSSWETRPSCWCAPPSTSTFVRPTSASSRMLSSPSPLSTPLTPSQPPSDSRILSSLPPLLSSRLSSRFPPNSTTSPSSSRPRSLPLLAQTRSAFPHPCARTSISPTSRLSTSLRPTYARTPKVLTKCLCSARMESLRQATRSSSQ